MDNHVSSAVDRARSDLTRSIPGLRLSLHAASDWATDRGALSRCLADIATGDIILVTMLFLEDHIQAVLPALQARRDSCDAMVCCMSAGEVMRLTRMGRFSMAGEAKGPLALLKRLRGSKKPGAGGGAGNSGAGQMAMLRRLPQILRFIPGPAQDVRAYFLTLQYWLAGSEENMAALVRFLVDRFAGGERAVYRGSCKAAAPAEYPEVGVYHPDLPGRISDRDDRLPGPRGPMATPVRGTVGLLLMRAYVLPGNAGHYDGVIRALEAKGLKVVPAFAAGLDSRPPVERFFLRNGRPVVDAVVSLTGFSLVGGPAYNDAAAAEEMLATLDVPYLAAHAAEFQTIADWAAADRGLTPVEATMMVAIPELDGATGPMLFGGRPGAPGGTCTGCDRRCTFPADRPANDMVPCPDRAEMLAARVAKLVALRRARVAERKVAMVLFNFPPNAGGTGTAAFLSVFASLFNTLKAMRAEGYQVDLPADVDALKDRILKGNAARFGTDANVHVRIPVDDHVRRERHLAQIEAQWGPAPGRQLADGRSLLVLGAQFGNVFVGIQPGFGYEGDPMRLLFEKGFAPTHAFSAFYRWLREDFGAHAVVHFGTHGALEFMPGKQTALSGACWPDRLIGDVPNIYLYSANNPSEGALAKRRSAATLVSYLTPSVAQAGLYRGLLELKSTLDTCRGLPPDADGTRADLADLIQAQAATLDLATAEPAWTAAEAVERIGALSRQILELEYTLIPHGLHVIGEPPDPSERADILAAVAESSHGVRLPAAALRALADGATPARALAMAQAAGTSVAEEADLLPVLEALAQTDRLLATDHEIPALLRALEGRFIRPAVGGDLIRTPAILPTGRNLHGFDPFRIPSAFAVADGARQAQRLLDRHIAAGAPLPESVALVLWGTDNIKNEGGPLAQALALMGAKPRFDSYGRLTGAALIPLEELGRPRIDVVFSLSGIFRDLLPLQTRMLAEAAWLAASADEPLALNAIRRHALAHMAATGCDLETASLRVFSNADGAYGANVNQMIDTGLWQEEDELAEVFAKRKSFAYGRDGRPQNRPDVLAAALADVDLAYQNLESVELGVTTIDHYFDTLGGITRAVAKAKGVRAGIPATPAQIPVYIGDQTRGEGTVRTLAEQVALETRTRTLNPKWYEAMLKHGYEGVRQIEAQVTNTLGWSATTGQVQPWVYQQMTQTFMLDPEMRERLAALNPKASARVAGRLLEAHRRNYWTPDEATLAALRDASDDIEDRLEGIHERAVA
jgi:magnesium chelatase subunit H